MPDTLKKHKTINARYEFSRARYAVLIVRNLVSIKHDFVSEFKKAGKDKAAKSLLNLKNNLNEKDILIVFDEFIRMIDPTIDREAGKDCKYLDWVCKNWIESPVKIEDLYKIKDNLSYFESISQELYKDKKPNQIRQIKDFKELDNLLQPYDQKQSRKSAEKQDRQMSEEERQKLNSESTIVYDGKEGQIIIPHTMASAQYWGNQTKWCISATKEEDNHFDVYNKNNPLFIYLPKAKAIDLKLYKNKYSSFKFAAVKDLVFDELDHAGHATIPPCLNKLAKAAQKHLSGASQDFLLKHGLSQQIIAMPIGFSLDKRKVVYSRANDNNYDINNCPKEWQGYLRKIEKLPRSAAKFPNGLLGNKCFILEAIKQNPFMIIYASEELQNNKEVVIATVKQNPFTIQYASKEMRNDKEVLMTAVKQSNWVLEGAYEDIRNDKDIILAAVNQSGDALRYASKELQNNKEIVLAAVTENGYGLRYASKDLRNNKEVVLKAVSQNGYALQYVSKELQNDKDIVLAAAKNNNKALMHSSEETLQIFNIVKKNPSYILKACEPMRGKKALVSTINEDSIAKDILEKGYGLSLNLVSEELLSNFDYVEKAFKIAMEHGNLDNMINDIRHVKFLWGDISFITNIDSAIQRIDALCEIREPSFKVLKNRMSL